VEELKAQMARDVDKAKQILEQRIK
jgi:hypothetical protein